MRSSSSMRRWGSIAILATCGGFPILDLHRTTQHSIRWKEGHHSYLGDIWPIPNIRPRPTSLTSDNLPTKHNVSMPDICQFWHTAALLRPVKRTPRTQGCIFSLTCSHPELRGAFFVWRAPIVSWPRIMCSQVRMLKLLEPSREMP